MSGNVKPVVRLLAQWLMACCLQLPAAVATGMDAYRVPVNIFGDGDPLNGVEDDREPVLAGPAEDGAANDLYLNAGTIVCDGSVRGTAMVVDTREFAADFTGALLLSAAHVFYDLDKKRLFRRCEFHFMGWRHAAGYRARIHMDSLLMGDFDPSRVTNRVEFGQGDWAFVYLRKAWKNYRPSQSLRLRAFAFDEGESFQQLGGAFRLVAFDSSAGVITASKNCTVVESERGDLGGGAWKGQLLDDCDSADGASGGGIIAVLDQQFYLVGIRNGSHWSEHLYPVERFPSGPPDGAIWDRRLNTNFGRAVDTRLLEEMQAVVQSHHR